MSEITMEGIVYRITYHSTKYMKPVVFIDKKDHLKLRLWLRENKIETNIESLPHPLLHSPCPQIQVESKGKNIKDGTPVKISIFVKERERNGKKRPEIGTGEVIPL